METKNAEQRLKRLIKSTDSAIAEMQEKKGEAIAIGRDPSILEDLPPWEKQGLGDAPEIYRLYQNLCKFRDSLATLELGAEIAKFKSKTKAFENLNERLGGIVADARQLESTRSGSLAKLFNKLEKRGKKLTESVGSTFAEAEPDGPPAAPTEPVASPRPSDEVLPHVREDPTLADLDPRDAKAVEIAIPAIKAWEGFRELAYDDQNAKVELKHDEDAIGTITIGYGTTKYRDGSRVKAGDTITESDAEALLREQIVSRYLEGAAKVGVWQDLDVNQRASLISFSYNVGPGFYNPENRNTFAALKDKTALDRWPSVLVTWNKETRNGKKVVNKGLKKRRKKELALWSGHGRFARMA